MVLSNSVPLMWFLTLFIIIAHYSLLSFVITLSFFYVRNSRYNGLSGLETFVSVYSADFPESLSVMCL